MIKEVLKRVTVEQPSDLFCRMKITAKSKRVWDCSLGEIASGKITSLDNVSAFAVEEDNRDTIVDYDKLVKMIYFSTKLSSGNVCEVRKVGTTKTSAKELICHISPEYDPLV